MRCITLLLTALLLRPTLAGDLTVDFKHDQSGVLNVSLIREGGSFSAPDKTVRAIRQDTAKEGSQVVLRDLAPGKYAIKAFLDLNNNQKLDKNLVGMPKEPYGFSNDATGHFGPPKIEDTLFDIRDTGKKLVIHLD